MHRLQLALVLIAVMFGIVAPSLSGKWIWTVMFIIVMAMYIVSFLLEQQAMERTRNKYQEHIDEILARSAKPHDVNPEDDHILYGAKTMDANARRNTK